MADEPKNPDAFRPQDPHIPGVTDNPKRAKDAAKLAKRVAKAQRQASASPSALASPILWSSVLGVVLVGLIAYYGAHWWNNARADRNVQGLEAAGSTQLAKPMAVDDSLPFGPGPVATTDELAETWSSKRFVYRAPQTADNIPAIVIKLPNNVYWGLSLREPFGTCVMEYVSDLAKLESQYHLEADHPMIGDPCSHAAFDLLKYGPGPSGDVRGATVSGVAVRPPIAIQMTVKGKDVVAVKLEE